MSDRFRSQYRPLGDDEKSLMAQIKDKASELDALYLKITEGRTVGGRYTALARTELEASVMWAVKELTT